MLSLTVLLLGCGPPTDTRPEAPPIPVRVERIEAATLEPSLTLLGEVVPKGRLPVQVTERGRISYSSRFSEGLEIGAAVARGELLFVLENDEVDHELVTAEISQRAAATELQRARDGVAEGFVPRVELQQAVLAHELAEERLLQARRRKERLEVSAPKTGYLVVDEVVAPGAEIAAGDVVCHIGSEGAPRIEALLPSRDLSSVAKGLSAAALRPASAEPVAEVILVEVGREATTAGAVRVIFDVLDDFGLPPVGEGVDVRLRLPAVEDVLSVPESALVQRSGLSSVFVLQPQGSDFRAERRSVSPGARAGDRVQIHSGLDGGEVVAVEGVDLLSDGVLARDVGSAGAV
ncbi:MAG: efflux RND transporter periplasmic adaptor subunit [Acidobacteriota bacterium]